MSRVELSKECIENALRISGYSKYRLAKESGILLRTIQRWFNTDLHMDSEDLNALCVIMDVEPAYLCQPYTDVIEDSDGNPFTIHSYHDAHKLTEKQISALSEEERKRVDPHGVYVSHFSKADLIGRSRLDAHWDCNQIMNQYVRTLIDRDLIKNSAFIKNNSDLLPVLTDYAREITDNAITDKINALMQEAHTGKEGK